MLKLGDVYLDDRGDVVYIPNRQRPPFVAGTPVELRNMLINAVLKVVKDKEGIGSRIIVYPQITCMYPKAHRHDLGQPYTDSEILLARGARTSVKETESGNRKRVDSSHRTDPGGARPRKPVQQSARSRRSVPRGKRP